MTLPNFAELLSRQPRERIVAACVCGAVGLALLAVCSLSALGRPAALHSKLEALNTQVSQIEAVRAHAGDPDTISQNVLCTRPLLGEATALHGELQQMGQTLHLFQLRIDAEPDLSVAANSLQRVKFTLDATGDYASAVRLLQTLDNHAPAVLLDRLDLTSRTTFLRLHLNGRVYCRTPTTG